MSSRPIQVAEWPYLGEIGAKASEDTAENIERWTENDNSQKQQKREDHVELAETLDTDINTGQHRCHGNGGNHNNQYHHRGVVCRNIKQIVEARCDLLHPQSERGGEP